MKLMAFLQASLEQGHAHTFGDPRIRDAVKAAVKTNL